MPTIAQLIAAHKFTNLKKLTTNCCLSQLSRLFETTIPSLITLQLHCAHFGIVIGSDMKWKHLPLLYPNLEEFTLSRICKKLTLGSIRLIAVQLPKLRYIRLPCAMLQSEEDKQMADELVDKFRNLPSNIVLAFYDEPNGNDDAGECCYNNLF
jgi:hypothetical protein